MSDITPKGHDFVDSGARIVTIAIYINLVANVTLLAAKIAALLMTNSVSVLASLVDGALDFLSTAFVWTTTALIRRQNRYEYPISRRRLEPLSVLVFAVVMVTSFVQVAIMSITQLMSADHTVVNLTVPSGVIMGSTVVVKGLCWFWCRLINNSSVQALAQDAMTDVIFNFFSIVFPLGTPPTTKHMINTNIFSRRPNKHLVPRPPRRTHPLHLHHLELGPNSQRTHPPPNRGRGIPRRREHPAVHDDAVLEIDPQDPEPARLLRRRYAECRGRYHPGGQNESSR